MKVYFERKVLVGFLLALGILTLLGIYAYQNSKDSRVTEQMVSRTNEVLYHIEKLHSTHLEIEAELIRYSIQADTSFKIFFREKLEAATKHYLMIQNLTRDNIRQQVRLDTMRVLGIKKLAIMQKVISIGQNSIDSVRMLVPSAYNTRLLRAINNEIEGMQEEEKKLLNQRMADNQSEVKKFNSTFLVLLTVTAVIIIVLFITINAALRARSLADQALSMASEEIKDLYNHAPCGYHSVNANGLIVAMNSTWLTWLGHERDQVINRLTFLNLLVPKSHEAYQKAFGILKSGGEITNLECEVVSKNGDIIFIILNASAVMDEDGNFLKTRSTVFDITDRHLAEQKVAETNKELEAFTYSVSHDLRAPLRSIDGYSKILQEDYGQNMDAESNRLIKIIRNNARRMGHLIDDLLDFSRLGRKQITWSLIHMNPLVDHVKDELMALEKGRNIQFKVNPLQSTEGDLSMLRQVWVNLISNALKYSQKKPVADIEIGCKQELTHVTYYIRDNGVGFDMKYTDKLFGVFQRLHRIEEFEGTGVGLALVHRIVTRHGGRIWAESRINQGATFFFFIPKVNLN